MKPWGNKEFWGVGSEYDPDWLLTEAQKKIRDDLMELCRTKIRPHAIECDRTYTFPRASLDAMGDLGLLGLVIPKDLGGMGETHTCGAMVVETLARYGCPATAMIYTMHLGACTTLLFRYHNNPHLKELLKRITKEKLVGALSASDPATGSHDWFPLSSKVRRLNARTVELLKYGSWSTGAGYADFYTLMTVSPEFKGNYANLSCFLVYKDEIRASPEEWSALGMHANMSGPLLVEGKFDVERMIGPPGDGRKNMEECIDSSFLLLTSCCWNGIALGCIDVAKKSVTRRAHADVGMRVCDYPVIQDYFGESLIDTNGSRSMAFLLGKSLDDATNNNDWAPHADLDYLPRSKLLPWLWQLKFVAAKNVSVVGDRMLYACGGEGYKTELGLERLIRDGKAGWVMAPSNELLKNLVGMSALKGFNAIDLWEENANERVLHQEVKKMTLEQKERVGRRLLEEASQERQGASANHPYQDTDFLNPFNTAQPKALTQDLKTPDGVVHSAALRQDTWTPLALVSRKDVGSKMSSFVFALPRSTDHTGCFPGQFLAVRVTVDGKHHLRYFSPVSRPQDFGRVELVLRFESQGIVSNFFKALQLGEKVDFQGPCGGLEYEPNQLEALTVLASGGGVTPGLQLLRCVAQDPSDNTKVTLLYYVDSIQDILHREELDDLAAKGGEKIKVVYTLGETPEGWSGEEGFIDSQMIDRHIAKPNGIKHKIVVCGGPTMSVSCVHALKTLGHSSENIFIYGQFGVEQVKAVYGRYAKLSSHRCDQA
ncbi:complex I assembly factor ACAD9, mitochondrial-like [Penaeus chinensis]|uniref:complex I assembly factor ACAD9, mitochondrial-like n=1 Tax=Penaeus chinensis TaxID=139456 RepID=UPI001FB5959F|nr:complex I assembly factor ACAD9, mitochondrial-like [Penaeus chinensis]